MEIVWVDFRLDQAVPAATARWECKTSAQHHRVVHRTYLPIRPIIHSADRSICVRFVAIGLVANIMEFTGKQIIVVALRISVVV